MSLRWVVAQVTEPNQLIPEAMPFIQEPQMVFPHLCRANDLLGIELRVSWHIAHEFLIIEWMINEVSLLCLGGYDRHLHRPQSQRLQALTSLQLNEHNAKIGKLSLQKRQDTR